MNKTKGYYLRLCANIGLLIILIGAVIALLFKRELEGAIVLLIGVVINIVPCLIGKSVYVCPKCKAEFAETDDKVVLNTSHKGFFQRALLTCPKCKKTNFMKKKLVSKEEFNK